MLTVKHSLMNVVRLGLLVMGWAHVGSVANRISFNTGIMSILILLLSVSR